MKKVLIVCLGNICRSPTAEAVLKARAKKLGVNVKVIRQGLLVTTKVKRLIVAQWQQGRSAVARVFTLATFGI